MRLILQALETASCLRSGGGCVQCLKVVQRPFRSRLRYSSAVRLSFISMQNNNIYKSATNQVFFFLLLVIFSQCNELGGFDRRPEKGS